MLQSFVQKSETQAVAERLAGLRDHMRHAGIDAFLVPRMDAWRGEWVQPKDERLAWISGFTGSAGMAAITADQAALFVDGRYRLQAATETDTDCFAIKRIPEDPIMAWVQSAVGEGGRIGVDPWLTSLGDWEAWRAALDASVSLVRLEHNPIDALRPTPPDSPAQAAEIQPIEYAGQSSADKRHNIQTALKEQGASAALITAPDSLAWVLNLRGHLIRHAPMLHGFGVIYAEGGMDLWLPEQPAPAIVAHLGPDVRLCTLDQLREAVASAPGKVMMDPQSCPLALLGEADADDKWVLADDPCALPKARKNQAELTGAKHAHAEDAVAMVRFLAWMARQEADHATLTEIDAVKQLEHFRRDNAALRDISFETIAGAGPNGAIVHYRVNETTNRRLNPGEVLLIDSGGQYSFGTTDITRCLPWQAVAPDIAKAYTRVLQGLIAMSSLRFPSGLTGRDIDAVARAPLWREGWDYDHGTGHGVGSYLGVHEGPQSLSRRSRSVLEAGMILSVEPGYYRDGAFGIRLENLVFVTEAEAEPGRTLLGFETLTTVPFERRLICTDLLSASEIAWLDAYHERCRAVLAGKLDSQSEDWMLRATAPLTQSYDNGKRP